MPDITMCADSKDCPLAKTCYRATATPKPFYQSYSYFWREETQSNPDNPSCLYYWETVTAQKAKRNT